eukprot:gene23890-9455_t
MDSLAGPGQLECRKPGRDCPNPVKADDDDSSDSDHDDRPPDDDSEDQPVPLDDAPEDEATPPIDEIYDPPPVPPYDAPAAPPPPEPEPESGLTAAPQYLEWFDCFQEAGYTEVPPCASASPLTSDSQWGTININDSPSDEDDWQATEIKIAQMNASMVAVYNSRYFLPQ